MKMKKILGTVMALSMVMSGNVFANGNEIIEISDIYQSMGEISVNYKEDNGLIDINEKIRLTATTYQQILKEYDLGDKFTFSGGT